MKVPADENGRPAALLTKKQLADELQVSTRTIENMMRQRIIPFIRATKRSVRFHLPRVLAALEKRETREVTR
jgi:excisionase family DNA binding protein